MNSVACWLPLVAALIVLGVVLYNGKGAKFIAAAVLLCVVAGFGSYYWYGQTEGSADARDAYVKKALEDGRVKFEGFNDQDTERVRVSRTVDGKKCSATFNVVLGDYEGKWPLKRGSGRNASDACGVNDVEDTSQRFEEGEGARSSYLDDIFKPTGSRKFEPAD